MEELKNIEELTKPDERNLYFGKIDCETNETFPLGVNDIYKAVEKISIDMKAPECVISQFNIARNLAVYSWFSYPFNQISEMKAFSCVEMALKEKFGQNKGGLKRLIKKAVGQGYLKDRGFRHITVNPENPIEYVSNLPEIMSNLRNELAHGSSTLHQGAVMTLQICADFINQLFENIADERS